ncbi:hypothetical protein AB9P05_10750 [Roseivirga sp. BDSF3-8]|uniref:hypothetical protein n=1 Tax=Roseivirga sp. BDSF3-8 TaxID=3241598 RepID=UPI003531AFC5
MKKKVTLEKLEIRSFITEREQNPLRGGTIIRTTDGGNSSGPQACLTVYSICCAPSEFLC